MSRTIEVVDGDGAWSLEYKAEADWLGPVFGAALVAIHHIGSTAVPGLRAKPTIDILVEVAPGVSIEEFYPRMSALGYDCRGECLNAIVPGTPGRHYFSKKVDTRHTHHVHVCHAGHHQTPELLALRDYLRTHPRAVTAYGKLKTDLAERFSQDNVEYMRGKDRFIKELIALAEEWRRPTKPSNATSEPAPSADSEAVQG